MGAGDAAYLSSCVLGLVVASVKEVITVNHFRKTKRDSNEVKNEGYAESVHDEGK